jgi:hypothetical protein
VNTLADIEALTEELQHLTDRDYSNVVDLWLCGDPAERRELGAMLELERRQAAPEGRLLLSPAPPEATGGQIEVGAVLAGERELQPFALPLDNLLRHITIFGQSGAGKTNLAFKMLLALIENQTPVMILDWKRNFRDLLAMGAEDVEVYTVGRSIRPFQLNPLIPPPGTSPETWLKKITEIVGISFYVGDGVASILHRGIDAVYQEFGVYDGPVERWPTFADVRDWIDDYVAKASYKDLKPQWIASTKRTLQSLCFGDTGRVVNVATPTPVQELLTKSVVLELDALSENEKTLIIQTLLLWIHHYRLQEEDREVLKHVIVIEEAHHVLRKEDPSAREHILDVVIREIRELGEGLIMLDQSPAQFSQNAIGNSATSMVFSLKDRADVMTAANFLLLDLEQRKLLNELPIGECVVKTQDAYRKPFVVRVPHMQVPKGAITDALLLDRAVQAEFPGLSATLAGPVRGLQDAIGALRGATTQRRRNLSDSAGWAPTVAPGGDRRLVSGDSATDESVGQLTEEHIQLIKDVLDEPFAGGSSRYKRLRWSVRHGNRVKDELVDLGLMSVNPVNKGDSQIKLLDLTAEGRRVAKQVCPDRKIMRALESREHAYWKNRVAGALADAGLKVEQEKPVRGGRVDVHASNGHSVAVEIETGASDIEKNIAKARDSGVDQVVVVPTNVSARKKVKKRLAEADAGTPPER